MVDNNQQQSLSLDGYDTMESTEDFRGEDFTGEVKSIYMTERSGKSSALQTYLRIDFTEGAPLDLLIPRDKKTQKLPEIKKMPGYTDVSKFGAKLRAHGIDLLFPPDNSYDSVRFGTYRPDADGKMMRVGISLAGSKMSWKRVEKERGAGAKLDHETGEEAEKKTYINWILESFVPPKGANLGTKDATPAPAPAAPETPAAPAPAEEAKPAKKAKESTKDASVDHGEVTMKMVMDRIVGVMGTDSTIKKPLKAIRNAVADSIAKEYGAEKGVNQLKVSYLALCNEALMQLVETGYLESDKELYWVAV